MPTLDRWSDIWTRLGAVAADERLFHDVTAMYQQAHRHYHTLQHLDECFEHLDAVGTVAQHPAEVELALWFHDAVYDLGGSDNEHRSAEWAASAVLAAGLTAQQSQRVHALIMATTHAAVPADIDAQVLVDADLVSLGAPLPRFQECERQIREENRTVPEALYRSQRKLLLQHFLARPSIYFTRQFQNAFEAPARRNLAWSVARL